MVERHDIACDHHTADRTGVLPLNEAEARDTAGHPAPLPQLHFIHVMLLPLAMNTSWLPSDIGAVD